MKTISEQKEILKALTEGAKPAPIPEKVETNLEVVIPTWQSIASTYPEAVQKAWDAITATRPTYTWIMIDAAHLKESEEKIAAFKTLPVEDNFITLKVQTGTKYKGKSVKEARKLIAENKEIPLGAFEVASILLTHPELLTKYEDLWIDCPGDEYRPGAVGDFSGAPVLCWHDGGLGFCEFCVGAADERFGSASAFLPQVNL